MRHDASEDASGGQNVDSTTRDDDPPPSFRNSQLSFPAKLHIILDTPAYNDIICWLHHGQSWQVLQPRQFEEKVLPLFFRHGRYASFTRQVNGWGFRRIVNGPDYNSYYHRLFIRGKPELCQEMKRPTTEERKSMEDKSPPDFYQMEPQAAKQMGIASSDTLFASQQPPDNGNSLREATFDVQQTPPSLSPLEQYYSRLQRELEVLEQRRLEILSHLELLSLVGARRATVFPVVSPQLLHQSHSALLLPTAATQPITTFQSELDSLRIQQALLLQQEFQSDREGVRGLVDQNKNTNKNEE